MRLLLEQEPGVSIVGEAGETRDLLAEVQAVGLDVLMLDWELPGAHGDGAARGGLLTTLRSYCPGLRVIALSSRPEARGAALAAGADAFVSKGDPPERLLAALHAVAAMS